MENVIGAGEIRPANIGVEEMNPANRRKAVALSVRVTAEMKQALENAARADRRSVTSLLEIIVEDYLTEKGYLPLPNTTDDGASEE